MNKYAVGVPEGTSGNWSVERFSVSRSAAGLYNINARGRGISPGEYTRLRHGRAVVMSDTPVEILEHGHFIRKARSTGGRVLIHGLGLGMCVNAILMDPANQYHGESLVEHVLVIEKSPDVIALVAPHYRELYGDRLEIRQENAFAWKPEKGQRWNFVWHDIWTDLDLGNLPEMATLHRRFGRRCDWQDSWGRAELKLQQRRERRREKQGYYMW